MSATARLYRRGKWAIAEDGSQTVEDVWEIRSTSETDTISTILGASGLPQKKDPHPELSAAIVADIDCDHHDEVLLIWYYNVRYSTKTTTQEDKAYSLQKVKGGMRSGSIDVPAFYDSRGYPLVNSAGDLYEGLTRKVRTRVVNVTWNTTSVPDALFNLADTINAAAVTIFGVSYPAGTCALRDVEMPDEPQTDPAGTKYYPITYTIEINPMGYFILLPNKGANELVYQTRTSSTAEWADVTKATYDGKTPTTDRRIIKRPIQSTEQQPLAGDIWLDADGIAVKVPVLTTTQLGTGSMTAGSATLTLSAGSFDSSKHVGALVRIGGCGPKGSVLSGRIKSVTNSSTAVLEGKAYTTGSGKDVYLSGAIVNQFFMEDLADWTGVPLPNNQP